MKNIIALLIGVLLLLPFAVAIEETYECWLHPVQLNTCVDLPQRDSDSTYQNITRVIRPDGIEIIGKLMNNSGGNFYYTYCNNNITGKYTYEGYSDNTEVTDWKCNYIVNLQGKDYETVDGIIYIALFLLLIVLGVLGIYGFISLPFENNRGAEGSIINVNWKKYLKVFIFCMLYLLFIALTYFGWNISLGILQFKELGSFFFVLYRIAFMAMWPLFLGIILFSVIQYVKDRKLEEALTRNLTMR